MLNQRALLALAISLDIVRLSLDDAFGVVRCLVARRKQLGLSLCLVLQLCQ
jgi:hypothetical protein